jgi:hypothetical protein
MTAVIRPAILEETLQKIVKHVVDDIDRFRLIINVDPIGENIKAKKVIKVAEKYFNDVIYNIPKEPSFPKAVKWVWSQVEAPFVFHCEDDMDILRDIDIDDMIRILLKYKDLSTLRLCKPRTPNKKAIRIFSCRWIYNKDGFYIAQDWRRQFGLNPILIKKEFTDEAVERMVDDVNPEKQFRVSQKYMVPLIKKWKYGLYTKPGERGKFDGIKGQRWKDKLGLQKPKSKSFLKWVKK